MLLRRIAIIGATIIIAGVLAFQGMYYLENPKSYFATYAEAEQSGIMEKGWLPEYLPKSATEINETHNIDTNVVSASFKYQPGDLGEIEKNCTRVEANTENTKWECRDTEGRIIITLGATGSATLRSSQ